MAHIFSKSVVLFYRGCPPNCADDFTDEWLFVNVGYHMKDRKVQINSISYTLDDLIPNLASVEDYMKIVMQAELFYSANDEHHHIPIMERGRIATFIKKIVEWSLRNDRVKRLKFYFEVFVPEEWLKKKSRMKMKIYEEDYDGRSDGRADGILGGGGGLKGSGRLCGGESEEPRR
ncbi:hypothetical protein AXF42_Ash013377 [Apostasia shenzhenica]|uniref:Uncharacterized protein n=1 Tax=Apostasia shenzhenica TaxID=1088818 RepID=A0A2I0A416_9ASPA|nr:hypothetical protein AXF42_Ash013377 [Apostasia shenzhenica]